MTTITRDLLKILRPQINQALADIAKTHGVKIELANAKFTDAEATFKLLIVATQGAAQDGASAKRVKAEADYKKLAKLLGCEPEWLGRTFRPYGSQYSFRVVGLLPNRPKNCILAERLNLAEEGDGKEFIFSPDIAGAAFRRNAANREVQPPADPILSVVGGKLKMKI